MTTSFYAADAVKDAMEAGLDYEFSNANTSLDYFDRLVERGHEAKKSLNMRLFGDANTNYKRITFNPSQERTQEAFGLSFALIEAICSRFSLPHSFDIIKGNALPDGAKLSRVLLRKLGDEKKNGLEALFPAFYNVNDKAKKELPNLPDVPTFETFIQNFYSSLASFKASIVLSTSMVDIMTASEFTGGWDSCYRFGGAYASSTIVRGLDSSTAMAFLVNGESTSKLGRFWVSFDDTCRRFVRFPVYGNGMSDANVKKALRHIQTLVAENLGLSNDWKKADYESHIFGQSLGRSRAYVDTPSTMHRHEGESEWGFTIDWPRPLCVTCGDSHYETALLCSDCADQRPRCHECGDRIREDEEYYDEETDRVYCESCYSDLFTTCDHCGDRIRKESSDHFTFGSNDYCESCYHDHVGTCDHCHDETLNEDLNYVESTEENVCQYCLDREYSTCSDCDELFANEKTADIGEYTLCKDCLAKAYDEEQGQFTHEVNAYYMHKESIFHALQFERFPCATPAIIMAHVGDYIIISDDNGNFCLAEHVNKTPLLVTYEFREQYPRDNDVRALVPGTHTQKIIPARHISHIVNREIAQAYHAAREVYDSTFGNDAFNAIKDAWFPRSSYTMVRFNAPAPLYQIGDRVVFKALEDIDHTSRNQAPMLVSDMHDFFDGVTPYRIDGACWVDDSGETWFRIDSWNFSSRWVHAHNPAAR